MGASEARDALAEALYTAIRERLEWRKKDGGDSGVDEEDLVALAEAYASVAGTEPD